MNVSLVRAVAEAVVYLVIQVQMTISIIGLSLKPARLFVQMEAIYPLPVTLSAQHATQLAKPAWVDQQTTIVEVVILQEPLPITIQLQTLAQIPVLMAPTSLIH